MNLNARPRYLLMEASSHCQLSCPVCPHGRGTLDMFDVKHGFMNVSDFRDLLDRNPMVAGVELGNWGEPLLNPGILDILEHAHKRGVRVGLNSNMNLRKEGLVEGLVDYQVRYILCSIDGASQEPYEMYRVNGNLEALLENAAEITRLKRKRGSRYPRLIWKFIAFAHNEHEVPRAKKMAAELDMEFNLTLPIETDLSVGKSIECAFSPPKDTDQLRHELGYASEDECRQVLGFDPWRGLCIQLWEQPVVNWNGDILGCCSSQKKIGGNAFRDGLLPSVNDPSMRYARSMVMGLEPPRDEIGCSDCYIYKQLSRSGDWLRVTPANRVLHFYLNHFPMPRNSKRWDAFTYSYLQKNLVPWAYWYLHYKFS
jgi:MoaA/NifB/PqqE/SkfB family radical SAM enzyme